MPETLNTDANIEGNTLLTEENAYTITGIHTYTTSPVFSANLAWKSGTSYEMILDHAASAERTVTFPNETFTVVGVASTQTLTNKTIALGSNTVSGTIAQFNTACTNATFLTSLSGAVLVDGTVPLTANWDVGAFTVTALKFTSDQSTGTAPLTVASTTVVSNLNADLLDGVQGSGYQTVLTNSAGLISALSDETGSGLAVFNTSPTLVTPALGTPASGVLTSCTGLPVGSVTGLGTNVSTFLATPSSSNLRAALTDETGSGSAVFATSPTLVTPALGTPASGVATNITGLPIASGVSGLGSGVATVLATPSSSNLAAAITGETGTGALVFATSPTLVTPALGTPASGVLTNATGLPVSGLANGTDGELITWNASGVAAAVAVGTAGHVLTSGGAGVAPTMQAAGGGTTAYAVTLANAISTTSEVDVVSFTIPADTWADGDFVTIMGWMSIKNNSGGTVAFNAKTYIDGTAHTASDNTAQNNSSTEQHVSFRIRFQRVGSEVWAMKDVTADSGMSSRGMGGHGGPWLPIGYGQWSGWGAGQFYQVLDTGINFGTDSIIKLSVTPATSHATTFIKLWSAQAWKVG